MFEFDDMDTVYATSTNNLTSLHLDDIQKAIRLIKDTAEKLRLFIVPFLPMEIKDRVIFISENCYKMNNIYIIVSKYMKDDEIIEIVNEKLKKNIIDGRLCGWQVSISKRKKE